MSMISQTHTHFINSAVARQPDERASAALFALKTFCLIEAANQSRSGSSLQEVVNLKLSAA
ncbi:hypothetical protein JOB18_013966 [Solea senegalensis]|uniref:Uncharacterized protein n=1 Tax=Solea senegalensis TaxID=28829 RepID=A0AAV6PJZ4_SOLSE|nr:hypothetical protein JOB18_013966 [Solea senegalensis]